MIWLLVGFETAIRHLNTMAFWLVIRSNGAPLTLTLESADEAWYSFVRMRRSILFLAVLLSSSAHSAEKVKVRIVDRRDSESAYSYTVPQQVQSTSNTNVNCTAYPNSADCLATTKTTGTITPLRNISYAVHGATFSLLLADGKIVVVNCESKYVLGRGDMNRRSCRAPIVDDIDVEFNKDNAKLFWPISIDGKKMESETYKILGILNRPSSVDNSAPKQ